MNHKSTYQSHCLHPCIPLEFYLKVRRFSVQCKACLICYTILFFFLFKKNVLGEYIDSRDAKGIADLLNEKLEAIQNKGKRKKSRNKVRILIMGPFAKELLL